MLSVLIVTWNSRDELCDCLSSLREFPPNQPHEIIVVDNCSKDETTAMLDSQFPEIVQVRPGWNTGYAAGNNLAFATANPDAEWLLTLNPDTRVTEGALSHAIATLQSHPEAGVLGARLIGSDGETQSSVRGFPTLLGIFGDVTGLGRLWPRNPLGAYRLAGFDYERAQFAPQPMGTFLMFRRRALESVGDIKAPFDESFPIFFNEVDLLKRLDEAGWRCWYEPSVQIHHLGGVSTRQVRKAMIWESHRSLMRYLWRHQKKARWTLPAVGAFVTIAALIRARGWSEGFRSQRPNM